MLIKPKQALNKAFLKVKPTRDQIKLFKNNLFKLIAEVNLDKREELHKNDFSDFLKDTYYKTSNYINIKDTIDLVIHNSIDPQSQVSVLIEAKSPTNKNEMVSVSNINTKSMQELILYYLRERISSNNLNLKHLIITNRYEWFIFDAVLFEKLFAQNKQLVSQFNDFEDKTLSVTKTKDFYSEIAKPVIEAIQDKIEYTYFDIREYKKYLENNTPENDNKLIPLFKIFSPEHLLKLPIANDNNSLDKSFYNELLHIIGLEETKQGSKKIITRKDCSQRDNGSLLENCITVLDNGERLSSLTNLEHYGTTKDERLFNVALELVIIWINRILFLKLLEGQLISFNKNSKDYAFLDSNTIKSYYDLNNLFFGVLAKQQNERSENNKKLFAKIPYLNSSLFDPLSEDLEKSRVAMISELNDNLKLPIAAKTVLKDRIGKKLTGEKNTLEYLFEFLNAYNFASDSDDEIQEDSKTIINAAVLGLIFEKINGYKDGSFFTPSFITMYMCRETIRRVVVDKFKTIEPSIESFEDVKSYTSRHYKIKDIQRFNELINSLTICDPAVGSGHFLVSALNEIIAIKSELGILLNDNNELLNIGVDVINDELVITERNGDLFKYYPNNPASQQIQKTLFNEKQTIIENCLFGVDINPNSVKICRLRLWIELLKNTYYKNKENHELETLPNIDINIKCGNSLISRYDLSEDISVALKNIRHGNNKEITVDYYRKAVHQYKNAKTREDKQNLDSLITKIKQGFSAGLWQASLFEDDANQKNEMETFYNNQNAFEWRFEFPEVLADNGEYKGFDVVIGNPPYGLYNKKQNNKIALTAEKKFIDLIKVKYPEASTGMINAAKIFYAFSFKISANNGLQCMIIPYGILTDTTSAALRKHIIENHAILNVDAFPERDSVSRRVFDEVKMSTAILLTSLKHDVSLINIGVSYQKAINEDRTFIHINELDKLNPSLAQIPLVNKLSFDLLLKIFNMSDLLRMGMISKCLTGEVDMTLAKSAITNNSLDAVFIKGVQIDRYIIKHNVNDISQGKIEYINYDVANTLLSSNKLIDVSRKRIVLQGLTGVNEHRRIKASIVEQNTFLANSCNYILENDKVDITILIAWLNSKVLNFVFKSLSTNSNVNGYEIDNLPFCNSIYDQQIIKLSKKIFEIKSCNLHADTLFLEREIDNIIYKIFSLNQNDINIIEECCNDHI